jgi:hypothetical protein
MLPSPLLITATLVTAVGKEVVKIQNKALIDGFDVSLMP